LLTFGWSFGDGVGGTGIAPHHRYAAPGSYRVRLVVRDQAMESADTTAASILDALPARAFVVDRNKNIPLRGPAKPVIEVELEPVEGAFAISNVDPASIVMTSPGTGSIPFVRALLPKSAAAQDRDGNGVSEIALGFAKADLRRLFDGLGKGPHAVPVGIDGRLVSGARIHAELTLRVVMNGGIHAASVAPNPLNPEATLSFVTNRPGYARVGVYSVDGRLVRTLLDESELAAGEHEVKVTSGGASGVRLPSGVYYYRIETRDGVSSGRFTVLK
jgi:PKD repeat protein